MRNAWENEKAMLAAGTANQALDLKSGLATHLKAFRRNEDGAVGFILSIGIMLSIMIVGGLGIDFMRHERERVRMQNTLDRAVLAAADLDQELDPAAVVADYFAKANVRGNVSGTNIDAGLNYRTVSATASGPLDSISMAGSAMPDVLASSEAEERINKVEISMVLDISGSMATGSRISNLRQAGKTFVDTVLGTGMGGQVSISLVPYSEHVNAGPDIIDRLSYNYLHNYSHCLEIPNSEFSSASFDTGRRYDQAQHFQWNSGSRYEVEDTVCPQYSYERIRPMSQDANALKSQINDLEPRAGTAIYMGMKWGVAFLDPSMQGMVSSLSSAGIVDHEFNDRPSAYTDTDTLKTVILMTDGINSNSNRISSRYYQTRYNHQDHWARYNFQWYLNNQVSSRDRSNWDYQHMNTSTANSLLDNICDAAKEKGIVVWSIGFEVDSTGADIMQNCASSPAHFFRVEGVEITEAFRTIARQLNQLRLTQ